MKIADLLDGCHEDRIRSAFGILCEALIQGDSDGDSVARFSNAIKVSERARDLALSILNEASL